MTEEIWTTVDRYLDDLFVGEDNVLHSALQNCAEAGLPQINVSATQGKLLMLLALARQCRRILEIGTLGGYSAIWLARALPNDGRLITLEFEEKHAAVARRNIELAGFATQVDVRLGRATDTLAELQREASDPFDFVFIDADKESYSDYLDWSLKLSHPGTMIVADNVVRDGAIVDSGSVDSRVRGVQRFNERIANDARISATVIQTVGAKGYDGMCIAIVKALS